MQLTKGTVAMTDVTLIGLDLAENVFQAHGVVPKGRGCDGPNQSNVLGGPASYGVPGPLSAVCRRPDRSRLLARRADRPVGKLSAPCPVVSRLRSRPGVAGTPPRAPSGPGDPGLFRRERGDRHRARPPRQEAVEPGIAGARLPRSGGDQRVCVVRPAEDRRVGRRRRISPKRPMVRGGTASAAAPGAGQERGVSSDMRGAPGTRPADAAPHVVDQRAAGASGGVRHHRAGRRGEASPSCSAISRRGSRLSVCDAALMSRPPRNWLRRRC